MNIVFGDTGCEFTLQHLNYGQILGGGCVNPTAIAKLNEMTRILGAKHRAIMSKKIGAPPEEMYFLKYQQTEYFPEFYAQKIDPSDPYSYVEFVDRKFNVRSQYLPVGNTSFPMESVIFDSQTNRPVIYQSMVSVNINKVTRRPKLINDNLKKYFSSKNYRSIKIDNDKLPQSGKKEYEMPSKVIFFSFTTSITLRMVDRNNHTNHSVYIDMCFDCLAGAFIAKTFGSLGSIFDHKLRRISQLFVKECWKGDEVVTTVWRDSVDPWCFCFHSTKDGSLLCQTEFEFFKPELNLKANL